MCYILCMCVWARQIRQLRLTIPTFFTLCVVCIRRFPGGSQGGPRLPPPGYASRRGSGQHHEFFFFVVFAILADFVVFGGFLN
jgi:hypothetical protein